MLLAARCRPGARDAETRSTRAGVMQATSGNDVFHAVLSMLFAIYACLATFDVEHRHLPAGFMCAALIQDVHHTGLCVLHSEYPFLAVQNIETGSPSAGGIGAIPQSHRRFRRPRTLGNHEGGGHIKTAALTRDVHTHFVRETSRTLLSLLAYHQQE